MPKYLPLKRKNRDPLTFDTLGLFAAWGERNSVLVSAPEAPGKFAKFIEDQVRSTMGRGTVVYGNKTQSMFDAVVANLSAVALIKAEDAGSIWTANSREIPDTRIVLENGLNLLVEVKSTNQDPGKPFRLRRDYLRDYVSYADETADAMRVAIFWSRVDMWTMVAPARFVSNGRWSEVSFDDALLNNDMGIVGDIGVGVAFPVRIRVTTKTNNGVIEILGQEAFANERPLTDRSQTQLLFFLMMFGEWSLDSTQLIKDDGKVRVADLTFLPMKEARNGQMDSGRGCVFCGALSRILSRYWNALTSNIDGEFRTMLPNTETWDAAVMKASNDPDPVFAIMRTVSSLDAVVPSRFRTQSIW